MANSIFLNAFGTISGGTINPSFPIAFTDGAVGAPAITWQNEPTSGWYRQASNVFRYAVAGVDAVQFESARISVIPAGGSMQVSSTGSFSFASIGFITAGTSTGQFLWRNVGLTAGVGIDVNTDAVLKVRTTALSAYATLDCLGLKASGAAGASGTGTIVSQLTVVNGIVTSCTIA